MIGIICFPRNCPGMRVPGTRVTDLTDRSVKRFTFQNGFRLVKRLCVFLSLSRAASFSRSCPLQPPPAPPPGVAPTLNADVDKLLADTDPDAANDKDDGAGSPAEPTGGEEKSGGNGKDGAAEEEDAEPAEPVEPIGEEFKPVDSRGCTDTLCCLLFLGCMALWCGVAAFVFYYGNPYSVIYGVDYEGSICSHSCGANTDPMSNCSAASIKAKKYAHFPRITSDLLAQKADIALGKIPVFYTVCVEECPQQWDVVCSYKYETKYPTWREYPAGVKACLGASASLNKFIVSVSPDVLTATFQAAEASGSIARQRDIQLMRCYRRGHDHDAESVHSHPNVCPGEHY